jgi:hypothetical protein
MISKNVTERYEKEKTLVKLRNGKKEKPSQVKLRLRYAAVDKSVLSRSSSSVRGLVSF